MAIDAQDVERVLVDCLFQAGEPQERAVRAEGITATFGFHPDRLAAQAPHVQQWLDALPEPFHADKGGGWSFLNACYDRDGQWTGEHRLMEALVVLGIALGKAQWLLPRAAWAALPGGMPYFAVLPKASGGRDAER